MYRKVSVTYARVRARIAASSIAGCVSVGFIILPPRRGRRRGEERGHVRRAIRLLGPLLHDRRNYVPRPAAQHGFFPQTAELALRRQTCRELKDAMIEEGVAGFDAVCQRHPVALRAQEIG